MPGAIQDEAAPQPTVLNVKELHPTFGAEITDFLLEDCNDVDFQQILALIAKVRVENPPRFKPPQCVVTTRGNIVRLSRFSQHRSD